jgi:hypothetical protein
LAQAGELHLKNLGTCDVPDREVPGHHDPVLAGKLNLRALEADLREALHVEEVR